MIDFLTLLITVITNLYSNGLYDIIKNFVTTYNNEPINKTVNNVTIMNNVTNVIQQESKIPKPKDKPYYTMYDDKAYNQFILETLRANQ